MEKIYGSIFKDLRIGKGLSIKEISNEEMSSSSISKFENGCRNITIDKFFSLLKSINISPQEYFVYLEETQGASFSISMINLPLAFDYRNYVAIERLTEEYVKKSKCNPDDYTLRLQVASLKGLIHQINEDYQMSDGDVKLVRQYLLSSKKWSEFEIQLYSRLISLFDDENLKLLTDRLLNPLNYPMITYEIRCHICDALVNLTSTLVNRGLYKVLKCVERYIGLNPFPERYMYQRGIVNFNFALSRFFTEDKKAAAKDLLEIIRTFEVLGCSGWVSRLKDRICNLKIERFID